MARPDVTTAEGERDSGKQTDVSYSSEARGADDGVEWQMALVVSGGKCSLLPSSLVVLIFDGPLDVPTRWGCDGHQGLSTSG